MNELMRLVMLRALDEGTVTEYRMMIVLVTESSSLTAVTFIGLLGSSRGRSMSTAAIRASYGSMASTSASSVVFIELGSVTETEDVSLMKDGDWLGRAEFEAFVVVDCP